MAATSADVLSLRDLPVGRVAHLQEVQLDAEAAGVLEALGLTAGSDLRLCKAGDPCIVQVGGTRIGVSWTTAGRIFVVPVADRLA